MYPSLVGSPWPGLTVSLPEDEDEDGKTVWRHSQTLKLSCLLCRSYYRSMVVTVSAEICSTSEQLQLFAQLQANSSLREDLGFLYSQCCLVGLEAKTQTLKGMSSPIFTWRWLGGWVVGWSVTLCSSALGAATDKFNTILERGQIAHEDPTIKNPKFLT